MTIARRRGEPRVGIVVAPVVPVAPVAPEMAPPPAPGVPLPHGDAPAPDALLPVGRLRRCTFRRIDRVTASPQRLQGPSYEVMCLYADLDEPLALGDVESAGPICESCSASGIFRPDED